MRDNPQEASLEDKERSRAVRSRLVSRNIVIGGRRTSVRLEPDMWSGFMEICRREHVSLHEACTMIAANKLKNGSLASALRIFIMTYYRAAATEDGHTGAGHGDSMPTETPATSLDVMMVAPRIFGGRVMMAHNTTGNNGFMCVKAR